MTQPELLQRLVESLEAAGIPYMAAGSLGSSFHGQPRATNDVDMVIDPSAEQLDRLVALVRNRFYVSREAALDALRNRSMFNIIDFEGGEKADLIIRKSRPFSVEEFSRRQTGVIYGCMLPIASPEDVILSKLEWNLISPSERQIRDVTNVAITQGAKLDRAYLRHWAPQLHVVDQLEELLQKAEQQPLSLPS